MAENENVNIDAAPETSEVSIEDLKAQIEKLTSDNEKLKKATTNASADASKWKKELQSRLSEQERKEQEEADEKRRLLDRVAELEASARNNMGTAAFVGVGMTDSVAKSATEAFYSGDVAAFTTMLKGFLTDHDKAIKAEGVRNTTPPFGGSTTAPAVTKEQFDKMGYRELSELYNKDPDLYNKLRNS